MHCHERRDLAGEVAAAIEGLGRRSLVAAADIADPGAVAEVIGAVERAFGRLDVLVNNAGFVAPNRLPEADLDVVHRIIDVNLKGPFHCIAAALPLLRASRRRRDRQRRGAQLAGGLGRWAGLCRGQGGPRRDDPQSCP